MKKLTLALAMMCIALTDFAYTHMPAHGLVAYYPCSGNYMDSSGNHNDLAGYNVSFIKDRFGRINKAAYFSGLNAYMTRQAFNLPDSISISAWLKPAEVPQDGYIFDNGQAGTNGIQCMLSNGMPGGGTGNQLAGFNGGNYFYSNASTVTDTNWKHVVTTITNGQYFFYVNDTLIASGSMSMNAPSDSFVIGACFSTYMHEYFYGALDDIRIYNRALTPLEIDTLYHETLPPAAVAEVANENNVTIYPNPASKYENVLYKGFDGGAYTITLIDALGRIAYQAKADKQTVGVDLNTYAPGIYYIVLTDESQKAITRKKLVIQ